MNTKKTIKKINDKELKSVSAQCCCQITGKSSVYEPDSCCKADCTHWFGGNDKQNTIYH
ncbi:MAG: hypothetical protein Q4B89_07430 [Lachnospiraceae bacterium]|nr:hypothetical protein [Lachnospiraceae bacterium]